MWSKVTLASFGFSLTAQDAVSFHVLICPYLVWGRNSSDFLPTFNYVTYIYYYMSWKAVFICAYLKSLIRHIICKYLFTFCKLSFYFVDVLWSTEAFNIYKVQFAYFSRIACDFSILRKAFQGHRLTPIFQIKSFTILIHALIIHL